MSGNANFRWLFLAPVFLYFLSACASGTLNKTSSPLQVNTSNAATGTGFLFSSSDYVITSYHVVHDLKHLKPFLIMCFLIILIKVQRMLEYPFGKNMDHIDLRMRKKACKRIT